MRGDEYGEGRDGSDLCLETHENQRADDSSGYPYKQPGDSRLRLLPDGVLRVDVRGDTGSELIVAFALLAHLVHDVVHRDLAHEPVDAVYHGHGHKVVFLKIYGHLVDGRIGPDGDRICLHDVLYFRDGGMGDHLFRGRMPRSLPSLSVT